jgi:hypothetical protein
MGIGDAYAVQAELPRHFARIGDSTHTSSAGLADAGMPSEQDMGGWATAAESLVRLDGYVGLIARPGRLGGWDFPHVEACVTRLEGSPAR